MSLINDYFHKTTLHTEEYGENTIVLIQVGAFFEVYGLKDHNDNIYNSKIITFANICDLNVVDKKVCCGSNMVVMAGFKDHLIEKYIKKLQDNGFTIIVYEQDEALPNTSRSLTGIYSPGTFFSIDQDVITNYTCCLWIENKNIIKNNISKYKIYIGCSVIDIVTGYTCIMEYNEVYIKNPCIYDELERFISIYNPSETIIVSNLNKDDINNIVSYTNIKSKIIHNVFLNNIENKNVQRALNCEKQTYQNQILEKFYKIIDKSSFWTTFYDNGFACQSFCYLLDFIYQHNPYLTYKIEEPILENCANRLILANHSLKQLNIIEDQNYKGKYSSVIKMLNECITCMGKRRFNQQFLNPTTCIITLNKEYDITEYIMQEENIKDYEIIKQFLSNIKDITKLTRLIMIQKLTPKSLYSLYHSLEVTKMMYDFLIKSNKIILLNYLNDKLEISLDLLIQKINNILVFFDSHFIIKDCKDIDNINKIEQSFIKQNISEVLDKKIKLLMDSHDQLDAYRSYFNNILAAYEDKSKTKTKGKSKTKTDKKNVNQENMEIEDENDKKTYIKIHETEKNNFSLIGTDRRCKILEESLKNKSSVIVSYKSSFLSQSSKQKEEYLEYTLNLDLEYHKQSATNKTIINSDIQTLCKNINNIKLNLIETIIQVYNSIILKMQSFQQDFQNIGEFITILDVLYTKAWLAQKYNYCKPTIDTNENIKSFIEVKDLRHCLIEKLQQNELYVSNDVCLGKNNDLTGFLLYGTNAVGKTSLIRSIGIAVIMAQAGLFVPADSMHFKPYKYLFTRIIGNDNLFKGLSTFAVEMSELRTILRLADENSLVLGDELCSGTESVSAISIFVAGIQALQKTRCSFIFATHIHEIVSYDEIVKLTNVGLKHMSVIYDKENDCLIYNRKLQDGPGTSMYGLEVCKSLNLPNDFLENALAIRQKYYPEAQSVLDNKNSNYNQKWIKGGLCELCEKEVAIDVHHLIYQKDANEKGVIKKDGLLFQKNNIANLINLCKKCHDEVHENNTRYKKTKTTKGMKLMEI
jgi:DNA mismatch repair protein MutS